MVTEACTRSWEQGLTADGWAKPQLAKQMLYEVPPSPASVLQAVSKDTKGTLVGKREPAATQVRQGLSSSRERFSHSFMITNWTWNLGTKKAPLGERPRRGVQSTRYSHPHLVPAVPARGRLAPEPGCAEAVVRAELLVTRWLGDTRPFNGLSRDLLIETCQKQLPRHLNFVEIRCCLHL